ncbi:MAG: outer membrane beta-barrel protein [Chitinophagales bacterium]|nr:outer membrane beta-barrel protein [Chitinophagales bacterium]
MKTAFPLILLLLLAQFAFAQHKIEGTLTDADDHLPMAGATAKLIPLSDSSLWQGTAADDSGRFQFANVANGIYSLQINYIGYKQLVQAINMNNADVMFGEIALAKDAKTLKNVDIVENQTRVVQKADTSEYNARGYKTGKDATVEDLVTKMPGITNENGTIKAQGETVQKVLIDGKEYFGDDASLALKNLPAEVVDRVQVFDRMGDQASFTGFDDGNSHKSMNILTKTGMNNGVFGKFYAGYGYLTDSRYTAGASVNWFNGNRRLSFIGMSNNINQQNFSSQDLLGLTGGNGGGQRPGGNFGGGQRGGGQRGGGGFNQGSNNFLVGQTGGISTTHSAGFNYSDLLGKKQNLKITGSYFFNLANNTSRTELNRKYFSAGDSSTTYKEINATTSTNMNHRASLRLEYVIDSMNTLIFTPKFNYQDNSQTNVIDGQTISAEGILLGRTQSDYTAKNKGYNASGDLLYQHKFKKQYRTISLNVATTINNKFGNTTQYALNSYQSVSDSSLLDQQGTTANTSYKVNGNLTYTEPAGKSGMVQLSYEPSYTWNMADKETFNRDSATQSYSRLDTTLSNKYDNDYMTHKASASYRVKGKQFSFMVGIAGQYALLTGDAVFPVVASTNRSFYNLLPNAMFNYKFKNNSNIRIMYRSSTNPPTVQQLQNVIDNTNPLLLTAGNPDLKQSFSHFMMVRYGYTNTKKGQTFFAFASANYTQNSVANSTLIARQDTLLNELVILRAGSQLTRPVNINGNLSVNSFFTYGMPVKPLKSNINFNAGLSYLRTPGLINNVLNLSNTYGVNGGLVLSSNINDKIDFTIGYGGNYSIVKNTLQTAANNNYYMHNANAKFNWQFWKGFVFNTSVQNTLYAGIANGFNQNIFLWNAAFGYKFLKDESLDVRFSVNDILNQNSGITRTVTETYVEDAKNQVLKRYVLLTVSYTLKSFKKKKS